MIGLFCKRALKNRWHSANETYNLKEPTNRSHPIWRISLAMCHYTYYIIIGLFCRISSVFRSLLQKRPIILRSLPIAATPYHRSLWQCAGDSPESCHTFEWVLLLHISVAQRTENATLCESENATLCESYYCIFLVLAIPLSHVTRLNESYHTFECVMSHVWMSHVTRLNESYHTFEWVMSHV